MWTSHHGSRPRDPSWSPERSTSPTAANAQMTVTSARLRASQELLQDKSWQPPQAGLEMEPMNAANRTYYNTMSWSQRPEHLPLASGQPIGGGVIIGQANPPAGVVEMIPPASPGGTAPPAAVVPAPRGVTYPLEQQQQHHQTAVMHAAGCPAAHQLPPQNRSSSKPPSRPGSRAASRATSRPASRSASRSGSRSASRSASRSGHRSGYSSPGSDLR